VSKMGFSLFNDGSHTTDIVAPKSGYPTVEAFLKEAEFEAYDDWADKIKPENVREGHCRFYPVIPDSCGLDGIGGCYSFSGPGPGAFPVWYINIR